MCAVVLLYVHNTMLVDPEKFGRLGLSGKETEEGGGLDV